MTKTTLIYMVKVNVLVCWRQRGAASSKQGSNYMATYLPSRKLSKLDETDMQDITGEVGMSS